MTGTWRPLALAAALIVTLAAAATAQTVIVTKTVPGAEVAVGVNATQVGTATSDSDGVATVPLKTLGTAKKDAAAKTEMDVRVFVDVCEKARTVWLVETGWQPPAATPACARHELFGTFSLSSVTTLVVEAGEENQSVWIRQGKVPAHWLDPNAAPEPDKAVWPIAVGLVPFVGAGFGTYLYAPGIACGSLTECNSNDYRVTIRAGADYWFGTWLAVTGSYLKPYKMELAGAGSGFKFNSTFRPNIATIGAKVGLPLSRFRFYGEGGATYQRSNFQTNQTMDPITAGDQTIPGGSQEFNTETSGWDFYIAGGGELWISKRIGLYAEAGRAGLQGDETNGGEARTSDRVLYLLAGLRFALTK